MRYLVDTQIFVWYSREKDRLSKDVLNILDDYGNLICVSSETLRELVTLWRHKPYIRSRWKTPLQLVQAVEVECGWQILYLHKEHYEAYAKLEINEAQQHYDPSDHLIIAQAIANRMPLISADTKFGFYRAQGLELIDNK